MIVESNITAACGAGSRADSPDSRTLRYPSSSCSLLDFIDAPRCARRSASNPPAHRGPSAAADGVAAPPACLTDSWSCVRAQTPAFVAAPPVLGAPLPSRCGLWGPATPKGPASRVARADVARAVSRKTTRLVIVSYNKHKRLKNTVLARLGGVGEGVGGGESPRRRVEEEKRGCGE